MDKIINSFDSREFLTIKLTDSKEAKDLFNHLYDLQDFLFIKQNEKTVIIKLTLQSLTSICNFYNTTNQKKMIEYYELYHKLHCLTIPMINDMVNYYQSNKDDQNTLKYLLIGAEKNDKDLIFKLANYYKEHNDLTNIVKYFEMIKDDKDASYELGIQYQKSDPEKFIEYLSHSSSQGHLTAMYKLGCYYKEKNDIPNMIIYLTNSAEKHHIESCCILGDYYRDQKNYSNMMKYYPILYQHNKLNSQQLIAMAFYYEYEAPNHKEKAIECYKKAHDLNKKDLHIIQKLIDLHPKDNIPYYKMATELGSVTHAYQLGQFFDKQKSYKEANKYYEIGAKQNHPDCAFELAEYYVQNDTKHPDIIKYYDIAMEKHHDYTKFYQYCFNHNKHTDLFKLYQKHKNIISSNALIKALDQYLQKADISELPGHVIELISELDLNSIDHVPVYIKTLKVALTKQLDMLKVHYKYAPGEQGYQKAKEHFGELLDDA